MTTYAIGDIQGCFQELMLLLEKINFNENDDELWFAGDLINRGPKSLEVLRFIKALPKHKLVLGNHDLHLLATAHGIRPLKTLDTFGSILEAPDKMELIDWLRRQPLVLHDDAHNYVMVHAGFAPQWDIETAKRLAQEVEVHLRGDDYVELLKNMYGNEPTCWNDELVGWDRLRCIINYFTRLRFCRLDGSIHFKANGGLDTQPEGCLPWYQIPDRKTQGVNILFGHWAALRGKVEAENIFALDKGCFWGGQLRAMRLHDQAYFEVDSLQEKRY